MDKLLEKSINLIKNMEEDIRRILIVDDNISIHEDFQSILLDEKNIAENNELQEIEKILFGKKQKKSDLTEMKIVYQLDYAFQGEEAIEMVNKACESNLPYSLIFMDVRMPPGIDGIKTIKEIWEKNIDVEIVLCTAYSDYSWNEILDIFGETDHLFIIKKPFNAVEIKQIALTLTTKWKIDQENKRYFKKTGTNNR